MSLREDVCIARHGYHEVDCNKSMQYPDSWCCKRCGADYSMMIGQHPKGVKVVYVRKTTKEWYNGPNQLGKEKIK